VEWTRQLSLTADWNGIDGLTTHLTTGYQTIRNYQHRSGISPKQFYGTLELSYDFNLGLPFWKNYQ
jgi:hypothetical protein